MFFPLHTTGEVLADIEFEKVRFLPAGSGNIFHKTWKPFIEYLNRITIHAESDQKQMPSDIKEKDRIKGSTCCAFDLQLGPAAPWQASCYLTPRWEGKTWQRKDDQSHSDPPWDSRLVWVNSWVLLGGPCGRASPFPLSGLWKETPNERHLLWQWAVKVLEEKQKWLISALIC